MTIYYFGYGRNTNRGAMEERCPQARPLGAAQLDNYRFRFARHADIVSQRGSTVHGVLWRITRECLSSLDRREGYPHVYTRMMLPVVLGDVTFLAWVYVMKHNVPDMEPSKEYWRDLCRGYNQFRLPMRQMQVARHQAMNKFDKKYGLWHNTHIDYSLMQQ